MAEISNDLTVSEYNVSNVALQEAPTLITADATLTQTTYGNSLAMVADHSSALALSLEVPRAQGIHHRVVYVGRRVTGGNLTVTAGGTATMSGAIHVVNQPGLNSATRPQSGHDTLTLAAGASAYDLNFVSGNNNWYVYGKVVSTEAVSTS